MNHSDELIAKLQEVLGNGGEELITKVAAKKALTAVIDSIVALAQDGGVSVTGLGVFKYVDYAERQARNPQTGGTLTVPATSRLKFKATTKIAKK